MFNQGVNDFVTLFFPRLCFACGNSLLRHEEILCTNCSIGLPETGFHLYYDNPVMNQFLGKIDFKSAASYYYFSKGGKIQHLVHQFKYGGFKKIGEYLGRQYGLKLIESPLFSSIDYIVPIPLHPKKEQLRGYNQAEVFAKGLAESMHIPINTTTLIRKYASETQTHKSRFGRWENVMEIFEIEDSNLLQNKSILLVDDVITTGSTMEAAGHVLMQIPNIRISACSLACAIH